MGPLIHDDVDLSDWFAVRSSASNDLIWDQCSGIIIISPTEPRPPPSRLSRCSGLFVEPHPVPMEWPLIGVIISLIDKPLATWELVWGLESGSGLMLQISVCVHTSSDY